jgi:hypothetical protein
VLIDRTIEVEQAFNSKEKIAEVGIIQHTSMRRDGSLGSRIKRVGKMLFVFNVMVLYVGKLTILSILGYWFIFA